MSKVRNLIEQELAATEAALKQKLAAAEAAHKRFLEQRNARHIAEQIQRQKTEETRKRRQKQQKLIQALGILGGCLTMLILVVFALHALDKWQSERYIEKKCFMQDTDSGEALTVATNFWVLNNFPLKFDAYFLCPKPSTNWGSHETFQCILSWKQGDEYGAWKTPYDEGKFQFLSKIQAERQMLILFWSSGVEPYTPLPTLEKFGAHRDISYGSSIPAQAGRSNKRVLHIF